jgi:hypothetical protein
VGVIECMHVMVAYFGSYAKTPSVLKRDLKVNVI